MHRAGPIVAASAVSALLGFLLGGGPWAGAQPGAEASPPEKLAEKPADEPKVTRVEPDAIPPLVAKAARARAGVQEIVEAEKVEAAGLTWYDVWLTDDAGGDFNAEVTSDGTATFFMRDIRPEGLPAAYREYLSAQFPRARIESARHSVADVYTVTLEVQRKTVFVSFVSAEPPMVQRMELVPDRGER